jgi:uncharacterized protein
MARLKRMLTVALITVLTMLALIIIFQRSIIYFPSHHSETNGLAPWAADGSRIGYARKVDNPRNVWLFIHGNAGQAADRTYALHCFSNNDSVYILEYPGYGNREGAPGRKSFDSAAESAYRELRRAYPNRPVCIAGESIGSGPASSLARLQNPPDKIVLVVPFDTLARVAKNQFPFLPTSLLLFDRWDNIEALSGYKGKVEIFGATGDSIIPVRHARELARALPGAVLNEIPGDHNDWSQSGRVAIRN